MTMKLAVNYSHPAAELLHTGKIQVDCFKCPAWPDLVTTVQEQYQVYVHFPLRVGLGINDAIDVETNQPADWDKVEALLSRTDTPLVNLHLTPSAREYPDIPVDTVDPMHVEMLTERAIKDVNGVVERFGSERVVVENDHSSRGRRLRPAFLPDVIRRVVEESGCGLLLDVSHARLAAHYLDMDVCQYIEALPLTRVREIHVSGVQRFQGRWIDLAHQIGVAPDVIQHFTGHMVDHLPITDEGWSFVEWALERVRNGAWGRPYVVTFEYGGVGGLFEAVTDVEVLAEQMPRLYTLVKK
ncbi:MAG: DUF692 family protein [Chloroflexota bacterium]|nr:DUF692 family protein [Chloroflexota bacterium]